MVQGNILIFRAKEMKRSGMSMAEIAVKPYLKDADCSQLDSQQLERQFLSGIGFLVAETGTGDWESRINKISCFSTKQS